MACGGTGGHLFPGLAVAEQLVQRGCTVTLLVSPKEVDQLALKTAAGLESVVLPAVGLTRGQVVAFLRGFIQSYRTAGKTFASRPPRAALGMGGFTSAPPILAAKHLGAQTFLHESNALAGRANRWLSWVVDGVFLGFPSAAGRLHNRCLTVTGTPVRRQFKPGDRGACRVALGLHPARPVVAVMGGSQGAGGINRLVSEALPLLAGQAAELQWLHLTGAADEANVRRAYAALGLRAVVHPFLAAMETALGAATLAVCRAGASSLAELAAMRVPAVLIPYPSAADNHQFRNARAFKETGAARLLEERLATPETLAKLVVELTRNDSEREKMGAALTQWHAPQAAAQIAEAILAGLSRAPAQAAAIAQPEAVRSLRTRSEGNSDSSPNGPPASKLALEPADSA